MCAFLTYPENTCKFCVCSWMLFHILLEYFVYCYIIKLEGTLVECELVIWPKDHQRSTSLLMIMYNWLITQNNLDLLIVKLIIFENSIFALFCFVCLSAATQYNKTVYKDVLSHEDNFCITEKWSSSLWMYCNHQDIG